MKPNQKILGYVVTRNAWPMVGLAVLNALRNGVTHVVIVDHRSDADTHQLLKMLQESRSKEISLVRTNTTHFLQRATYVSVLKYLYTGDYDWVYAFDSDEFIFVDGGRKLSDFLRDVSPDVNAVRYEVKNFAVPSDFDSDNAEDFLRINQRAVIDPNIQYDSELGMQSLIEGSTNFLDWPFPSKLITRVDIAINLHKGGHSAVGANEMYGGDQLNALHVPFSSRSNLAKRAAEGKEMKTRRYLPGESWQQRALHEIEERNDLDNFWLSHTLPGDQAEFPSGWKRPKTETDPKFSVTVRPVVEELLSLPMEPSSNEVAMHLTSSNVPIDTVIELVEELEWSTSLEDFERFATDHQQLTTDHQQLTTDHQQLTTNLDLALDAQRHLAEEVRALRRSRAFRIGGIVLSPITVVRKLLLRLGPDTAQNCKSGANVHDSR